MHDQKINSAVLRPGEAAKYIGVSCATYWRLVQRGKISKPFKISTKAVASFVEDLDAYLLRCANESKFGE